MGKTSDLISNLDLASRDAILNVEYNDSNGFTTVGSGGDYATVNAAWTAGQRKLFLKKGTHTLTADLTKLVSEELHFRGESRENTILDVAGYRIDNTDVPIGATTLIECSSGETFYLAQNGDTITSASGTFDFIAAGVTAGMHYCGNVRLYDYGYKFVKVKTVNQFNVVLEKPWYGDDFSVSSGGVLQVNFYVPEMVNDATFIMENFTIKNTGVTSDMFIRYGDFSGGTPETQSGTSQAVTSSDCFLEGALFQDLVFRDWENNRFTERYCGSIIINKCDFYNIYDQDWFNSGTQHFDCNWYGDPSYTFDVNDFFHYQQESYHFTRCYFGPNVLKSFTDFEFWTECKFSDVVPQTPWGFSRGYGNATIAYEALPLTENTNSFSITGQYATTATSVNSIQTDGGVTADGGYRAGSVSDMVLNPDVADGATAVAYKFDTLNALATAGAKIASFQTNSTEVMSIHDGGVDVVSTNTGVTDVLSVVNDTNNSGTLIYGKHGAGTEGYLLRFDYGVSANVFTVTESGSLTAEEVIAKQRITSGSFVDLQMNPDVVDGATAVAYKFDTNELLDTAGAKIASFQTNSVEVMSIHDGGVDVTGDINLDTYVTGMDAWWGDNSWVGFYDITSLKNSAVQTEGGYFFGSTNSTATTGKISEIYYNATEMGLIFDDKDNTKNVSLTTTGGLSVSGIGGGLLSLSPYVADGASAITYKFGTVNDLATAGAKIASFQNQTTEVMAITKDGVDVTGSINNGTNWSSGTGTPEGVVSGSVGDLFTRTDGGANTTLYVKESGISSGLAITSITSVTTTATVTTTSPHNLLTNAYVVISGAVETEYNGTYQITVTGASTFTYTFAGSATTPATGTILYSTEALGWVGK